MLTLPPALATLAKLTAKPNSNARYTTTEGVFVNTTSDGWQAAASDMKRLILVSGPHPEEKPQPAVLNDAPNGATSGCLSAKWWASTFGEAKKVRGTPGVCLVLSDRVASATADGVSASRTEVIPGRVAPYADILPKRESDIGCTVSFDADLMAGLLKALADLSEPGMNPVVTMEVRRPNGPKADDKPYVLRAMYPAARLDKVIAMIMPCGRENDSEQSTKFFAPDRTGPEVPTISDDALAERFAQADREREEFRAEAARLRVALAAAEQGAIQQGNVIRILEEQIEEQAGRYRTLADTYDQVKAENQKLREANPDLDELAGLWGRLGDAERTTRDAVAESERLRAELDAVRSERDRLRADVEALRARPTTPAPAAVHHQPSGPLPVRRTLGQLAAARKGGA